MKNGQLSLKTVVTRAAIIAFVADHPRAGTMEIARAVNLSHMTVGRHLKALVAAGLLVRERSGKYGRGFPATKAHTHPEILHPEARHLLALELKANWRRYIALGHARGDRLLNGNSYSGTMLGIVQSFRRVDLYLRTGAGKEF